MTDKPFYQQPFEVRLARIVKLYDILKKQGKQMPLATLVAELHYILEQSPKQIEKTKKKYNIGQENKLRKGK